MQETRTHEEQGQPQLPFPIHMELMPTMADALANPDGRNHAILNANFAELLRLAEEKGARIYSITPKIILIKWPVLFRMMIRTHK
jgi:hypothetical protein